MAVDRLVCEVHARVSMAVDYCLPVRCLGYVINFVVSCT